MRLELVIRRGLDTGVRFPIPPGKPVILGRHPEAEVRLPIPFISRRHASLEWKGCEVWLEDLNSRNGVYVNGRRLEEPSALQPGTTLSLGGVHFALAGAVTLEPNWLRWQEGLIPRLVRQIEEEEDLTTLPILGDALEEVGCTDADLLAHCHGVDHRPPCWVFQLLRGAAAEGGADSWLPGPSSLVRCELR